MYSVTVFGLGRQLLVMALILKLEILKYSSFRRVIYNLVTKYMYLAENQAKISNMPELTYSNFNLLAKYQQNISIKISYADKR